MGRAGTRIISKANGLTHAQIADALGLTDRELEMILAEPDALDIAIHEYLAEYDLEGWPGSSDDD